MESHLYQELTGSQLDAAVRSALGTSVLQAKLLTGGLFNTTYLVDTADCGRVVLRVGPINTHLLLPFERTLMEAECHVYTLLQERQIPASEVLALDVSRKVIDRDFMIVRYIPSKAMSEIKLDEADWERICRDIGRATAQMHQITDSAFGRAADVKNGRGFSKWSDCLLHELAQWESVARPVGLLDGESADIPGGQPDVGCCADIYDYIRKLVQKAAPALDEITVPHLVHTDFWTGNILISEQSDRPEFAAIIDADKAIWGDSELEFANIGWARREPAFWEGYGKNPVKTEAAQTRRSVYRMIWNLLDYYIFTAELTAPEDAEEIKKAALEEMKQLAKMV